MTSIALGKTLLGIIIVLSITGMTSIILSFFYDKIPEVVVKKLDSRYTRNINNEENELTILIKEWESPMVDGDNL